MPLRILKNEWNAPGRIEFGCQNRVDARKNRQLVFLHRLTVLLIRTSIEGLRWRRSLVGWDRIVHMYNNIPMTKSSRHPESVSAPHTVSLTSDPRYDDVAA